jgi:uncharacterized protein GlcG (DUF336 family)
MHSETTTSRSVLSDAGASQAVEAAVKEARTMLVPITVVVVDEGGNLKALRRMDGAPLVSIETAKNKAFAAAAIGMPVDDFFQAIREDAAAVASFASRPGLALIAGGCSLDGRWRVGRGDRCGGCHDRSGGSEDRRSRSSARQGATVKALVICRPSEGTDPKAVFGHIAEEARALEDWRDNGTLVEAYSPGGPGAILILEVQDVSEAEVSVAVLPLRKAGLIQTEVIGLHPLQY